MKHFNFNQSGGYPLDTDTFSELQEAYKIYSSLTSILGGDHIIVKGVSNDIGGRVSDGVVAIGGELMEFKGGTIQANVIIVETTGTKIFENGEAKEVVTSRTARFGSGSNAIPWSNFKTIKDLDQLQKASTPIGLISMWAGAIDTIPEGWKLCNGSNGTPNLTGRFIVGHNPADSQYGIGKTGGAATVTLTESQMPKHKHTASVSSAGAHTHSHKDSYYIESSRSMISPYAPGTILEELSGMVLGSGRTDHDNNRILYRNQTTQSAGSHTHNITISEAGESKPHENRPPYYALAFIQFKG